MFSTFKFRHFFGLPGQDFLQKKCKKAQTFQAKLMVSNPTWETCNFECDFQDYFKWKTKIKV